MEHAAGSYTFEEEGLGYAMVMIIDKIEDFDFSSSIVTTTKIWGGAKSPIGITGIMCDIYLPSIDVHFVGGIDVKNYANSKTFTKLVEPLAKEGLVWGTTEYDIVLNGINNGIISTDRSFLDKICRLKTSK